MHKRIQINTKIENLGLSVRSYNCLKEAGIEKVDDLVRCNSEDLLKLKNFGKKSFKEIITVLRKRGFVLSGHDINDSDKVFLDWLGDVDSLDDLLNTPIIKLDLSVRSLGCLKEAKILTIRDLINKSEIKLLKYENFGRRSLGEIISKLSRLNLCLGMKNLESANRLFRNIKNRIKNNMLEKKKQIDKEKERIHNLCCSKSGLYDLVLDILENTKIKSRNRKILIKRFVEGKTLSDVAEELGLTRERIRQLEKKCVTDFFEKGMFYLSDTLEEIIHTVRERSVIRAADIEELFYCKYGWSKKWRNQDIKLLERIILFNAKGIIMVKDKSEDYYFSLSAFKRDKKVDRLVVTLLQRQNELPLAELSVQVKKEINQKRKLNHDYSEGFIHDYLKIYGKKINVFVYHNKAEINEIKGANTVKELTYAILKKENRPLHFREVAELVRKREPFNKLTDRYIHHTLIGSKEIVNVDRGTYALKIWNIEKRLTYTEQIEEILLFLERPLIMNEIISEMEERGYGKEVNIRAALDQNPRRFIKEGRAYRLKNNMQAKRKDFHTDGQILLRHLVGG